MNTSTRSVASSHSGDASRDVYIICLMSRMHERGGTPPLRGSWPSGRRRPRPSRRFDRSWCCNRSTAASPCVDYFTGNLPRRTGRAQRKARECRPDRGGRQRALSGRLSKRSSTTSDPRSPIRPKPDLIVTVGGPAAVFARKHRQQLFPDTPLLFAAVDQRYLRDAPLGRHETAVAVEQRFSRTVDEILQLLPETRQVFMVMGSGQLGAFWHRELEAEFKRFRDRLTFIWSDDLSFAEILRRCASLPGHSAILYVTFGTDAQGGAYADERVLADLRARRMPLCLRRTARYLGSGIVGGTLMTNDDLSREHRRRGYSTLERRAAGEHHRAAATARVSRSSTGANSSGGASPRAGCRRERRALSRSEPVERIQGHGAERRRHAGRPIAADRRAPLSASRTPDGPRLESRRNLMLAADASRRQTMSALTSSIAHELGQPLSSMIHNAQAGRMMITANRATPDTMGEILSDIESEGVQATQIIDRHRTMLRGHQLDTKPIDLHAVIHESLALVGSRHESAADRSHRQSVVASLHHHRRSGALAAGAGEPDDERHGRDGRDTSGASSRHHQHRSQGRADVDVSVRDTGTGLPAQIDGTLFTPFVTTKAHGLGIGLTITRTIVERTVAPSTPTTIPKAARHSRSPCAAVEAPECPVRLADARVTSHRKSMLPKRPRVLIAEDHPGSGEGRLPDAVAGVRCRGKHRRRQRRAGSRATAPTRRDCGRPELAPGPRTGGVSSDHAGEPKGKGHRVLGDERSGCQTTIRRGRSIGLCV